jgi:hypothetical protein
MSKSEKGVIETMLGAVLDDGSKEHSRLKIMFKQVASHKVGGCIHQRSRPYSATSGNSAESS